MVLRRFACQNLLGLQRFACQNLLGLQRLACQNLHDFAGICVPKFACWICKDSQGITWFCKIRVPKFAWFCIGEVKRQKVAKQRQQRLRLCMHSHCMPKYSDSDSVRTIRDNYKRFFASGRNFGLDIELSIQIQ
jgi:hypothetical protein